MMKKCLLVVDLEATCWDGYVEGLERKQTVDDMEIIEFGCAIAAYDGTVIDSRSFIVRPQVHPRLSSFCTALTSITQQDVDSAPVYAEVVNLINVWSSKFEFAAWGSWGDYDRNQIHAEQHRYHITPDFFELPHINLKQRWREGKVSNRRSGLANALKHHGLCFEGMHHRGIDDARNIARLIPFIKLDT
tara:strand:- start:732 stop:1298 length:567 start_codon:yes stop_codon:yes gene_type:complete